MMTTFSQLTVLGASLALLCAFVLLARRGVPAHVNAFAWQSTVLAGVTAVVAHYGGRPDLFAVAAILLAIKGVAIPWLLRRMEERFHAEREMQPYVNTATSLVIAGLLVVLGYTISRPLVALSHLPTRAGMPLAMGLVLADANADLTGLRQILDLAVDPGDVTDPGRCVEREFLHGPS